MKPQHIFIGAMIVSLALFLFWRSIEIFDLEIPDVNYLKPILSIIEITSYSFSIYFLIWIESRVNEKITLRLPVYGLILSGIILTVINSYLSPTLSVYRMLIYFPNIILMTILIIFLLKKKGEYASEFKFIGTTFLISTVVMFAYPVLLSMITLQYLVESIPFSVLSSIIQIILILPKIAILILMIKSLKDSTDEETEVLDNY
ncbi:hypothetical protein [Sporocytophaga myxococcoides]|uniref:hypothetical protein n=1 Tax=Sporocytophaga myxococcoides TaxID=153721 RepID=UPI0012DE84B5|nr:hypothetical protein [Sporocytophaga myxococcoides]